MQRELLIEQIRGILAKSGFAVSDRCHLRPVSFDLVARRDRHLVMVKVLANVDALSESVSHEIKILCKLLEARPLLVGLRAGTGPLESGVVYNRHDIPIVNPETLEAYLLDGEAPMAFAAPGGFYVHLDPEALRLARHEAHLSLGVLAQIAGVSRRAIQMYEEGMSASIEAAVRLEDFLGAELIRPTDPFTAFDPSAYEPPVPQAAADPLEALVTQLLEGIGYAVQATRRSPFHALSTQEDQTLLTGVGQDSPQLRRRARMVESMSRIIDRPGMFVVEHTTRTTLEGVPVVSREELRRLADPQRILDLLLERQARQD